MLRFFTYFCLAIAITFPVSMKSQSLPILQRSHNSTVKILSPSAGVSGSGSLIGDRVVLTCLHVVVQIQPVDANNVNLIPFSDLVVEMPDGEKISATLASIPTPTDSATVDHDFAFLRLATKPTGAFQTVEIGTEKDKPKLGDDIAFSGYPLNTPGMVTHRGMVSGTDKQEDLIFIEGSINKGNSGGGLLGRDGHLIGIISLREGGITTGLAQLRDQLNAQSHSGMKVTMLGMDPVQTTKMLIDTLDQYISTGIGYAHSIRFAKDYQSKHPELTK